MSETIVECKTCDGSGLIGAGTFDIDGDEWASRCRECIASNNQPTVPQSLPDHAPDAGEREPEAGSEVCPRCHCTMNDKQESVITNHSDQDRPRREHEKLSGCAQALMHERPKLLAHLDRQAARLNELTIANFALRERTGQLTALEDVHRQRYENMREALGVAYPTSEQIVGASIAAIHERNGQAARIAELEGEVAGIDAAFGNASALNVCKTLAEKARHAMRAASEYSNAHARLTSERTGIMYDMHVTGEGGRYIVNADPGPVDCDSLRMALRKYVEIVNAGMQEDRERYQQLHTQHARLAAAVEKVRQIHYFSIEDGKRIGQQVVDAKDLCDVLAGVGK